jgi:NTE family protein
MSTPPQGPKVVLVLQGGGGLGAYHIGAYQALQEADFAPEWVCGTSIGAINAAVLVGNKPDDRLDRLEELWEEISRPDGWGDWVPSSLQRAFNTGSAMTGLLLGQPHFFTPNVPNPYMSIPGSPTATSFYDTSPMRATLERLADFHTINSGTPRLSLGATNVTTGDLTYFDNTRQKIGSEHVLASGSLPPGFPATVVDGEQYWDGGIVSNTPLGAVLDDLPSVHTVVFMIDLWSAAGKAPSTLDEVLWRQKEIQYASRTTQHIKTVAARINLRHQLHTLTSKLPTAKVSDPGVSDAVALAYETKLDIVHIVYSPSSDQISSSDAEFSRSSIAKRRAAGYDDLKKALQQAPWRGDDRPAHVGAVVHRLAGGRITQHTPLT